MADVPNPAPAQDPPNPAPAAPAAPPAPPANPNPAPDPPAAPVVPETYELALAEGSALDAKDLDTIRSFAKEHQMSQEQAAKLLAHNDTTAKAVLARQMETFNQTVQGWIDQTKADKDIGGANFDQTQKHIKAAMDRFAPEGSPFRKLVNESGYGNHPEFVRVFSAIGKAMAEDQPAPGGGAPSDPPKSRAEIMFPNHPRG